MRLRAHVPAPVYSRLAFSPRRAYTPPARRRAAPGTTRFTGTKETNVARVTIEDGIIKIAELDIMDPKTAAVLAGYPEARWAEMTRRAVKIGLGVLKGGAQQD